MLGDLVDLEPDPEQVRRTLASVGEAVRKIAGVVENGVVIEAVIEGVIDGVIDFFLPF